VAPAAAAERQAVGVVAHVDDAIGAEELRRDHAGEAHRAVADHHGRAPGTDTGVHGRVVAGGQHIAQGKHLGVVLSGGQGIGDPHQGAARLGHAQVFGLATLHLAARVLAPERAAEDAALRAGGLHVVGTARARIVGEGKRRDHAIAHGQAGDRGAHLPDHAHELVPQAQAVGHPQRVAVVQEVQVGSADARLGDAHDGVRGGEDLGIGDVLDADVAGTMEGGGTHVASPHLLNV